ncbi:hydantoinase/oxoprolinase family protein [Micromonospora sp. NPDC047740]|uniref:hydantoinase/oxoprolinase family protein n=1 Tax=Micromonospora sp. NPDC047740 TaxID=3364254 RepID=UPI0037147652
MTKHGYRVGVDVGGTFTDLVLHDEVTGAQRVHKVSSTPDDPSRAIVEGLRQLCELARVGPADIRLVVHGTTVATNMVIERTGVRVGMLTTEGFRDVMHIGRKKRPYNFSHSQDVPWQRHPLVRRRDRLTVPERVTAPAGAVEVPLDTEAVRAAAQRFREEGVGGVAVCFLFSFLNPEHERRAAEILRAELPGTFVSASHEVVPLHREYERFSSTAMNVYVGPGTSRYLRNLQDSLATYGVASGVRLMTSSGGVVTASAAAELPVSLLMSGPAGGLLAGIQTGIDTGHRSVITLDVGGTSSDIGVAPDGELRMKHLLDTRIRDYQVMVPMADIETIGAGGGSIAAVSGQGVLEVGPASAGATPGPVCYGRGGTEPTASDAAAVLGWLRPETFFGGRLPLRVEAARAAVKARIADPLGLSVPEAALGIHTVMTHTMAAAILQLSVRRGHDPRRFDLIAQGGAGPLFACSVGAEVGARRVVVPPHPGIASALGLLSTDLRYEYAASVWQSSSALDLGRLGIVLAGLADTAAARLRADGLGPDETDLEFFADCRYAGQGYELRVRTIGPRVDDSWVAETVGRFHDLHEATYRSRFEQTEVQIVNIRVIGVGRMPRPPHLRVAPASAGATPRPIAVIKSWFRYDDRPRLFETPVYQRADLAPGMRFTGPAIVEQPDTTTVVEPRFTGSVDDAGNLVLVREERG